MDDSPIQQTDLPPFAALRAFDACAQTGGIRKAARALNIHHSVVSRHVAQLEAWLGIALVDRRDSAFALTEDGARFHGRIAAAIGEIASASREAMGRKNARPLSLWCSPGLSIQWLAAQIAEFELAHPHYRIELKPSETPANLALREADANIYFHLDGDPETPVGPGLKGHELARPVGTLAASPDLARRLPAIGKASDLLSMPLLHGSHRKDWQLWFRLNDVVVEGDVPGELCWHPNMALEAARLGRGILLANRFFFERSIARGELVELALPESARSSFGTYLFVAREDNWSLQAMTAIRHFLSIRMKAFE